MNNSSMNNTSMKERNSGLNGPNFKKNNSMNNYSKENKSDLKTATLDNNITMDNHTRSYILDEPVPHTRAYILDEPVTHIGVATLRPTLFRRIIQRLKDTTRKVVDEAKRKWNDHYDWIIGYNPQPIIRDGSSIRNLKNHIRELYQQSPDFTPVEKKAAKGYFKPFTVPGNEYPDPNLYLTDV